LAIVGSLLAKKAAVIPLWCGTEATFVLRLCSPSMASMSSTGRPASFRERDYIVNPHRKLVVEGFRQSTEAVAAFRSGPVRESYAAEKYHNTRDVRVIGIALFNEIGSDPWTDEEVRRRLKANPFPGRFATPP
jgi:hypothetical protein